MLERLWHRLKDWFARSELVAKLVDANPSPETVGHGQLIVVGRPGYQKWAYLRCPCGCGEVIMLSLVASRRPRWTVKWDERQRPTVHPSVRQIAGCLSHFWIRSGAIEWCADSGHGSGASGGRAKPRRR